MNFLPALLVLPRIAISSPQERASNDNILSFSDGRRDATSLIQSLVDASLAAGGVVAIPAGKYLIDADKGISLRSGIHFSLDPKAQLIAKPSANPRYAVIRVYNANNVSISGGSILGERDSHLGHGGEWGSGIEIRSSSNVTVSDMHISKCWGDGIFVGIYVPKGQTLEPCSNIVLQRVVCVENRRQGLSILSVNGMRVLSSEFRDTVGTSPACGIDIEPEAGETVENVEIADCTVTGNAGSGIEIYGKTSRVAQTSVTGCTIANNKAAGIVVVDANGGAISNNSIIDNASIGTIMEGKSNSFTITENTYKGNATIQLKRILAQIGAKKVERNIQVSDSTHSIHLGKNKFND